MFDSTELSGRELLCLQLIASGQKSSKVASQLGVHAKTVEKHLQAIRRKMGAKTTAHAVAMAVERKWVSLQPVAVDGTNPPSDKDAQPDEAQN